MQPPSVKIQRHVLIYFAQFVLVESNKTVAAIATRGNPLTTVQMVYHNVSGSCRPRVE